MIWYKNLYCGKKVKRKKKLLIQKIESGNTPFNTYLIMLPVTKSNQLEILSVGNLFFRDIPERPDTVIGLAFGREEAFDLLQDIVTDVWIHTGTSELRAYFEKKTTK